MSAATKAEQREANRRPHILIVSDDTDLSQFLSEGLVIAGFWTSTVASALQCLEVFRLRTFDLMLVDPLLGGLGTVELVTRLRSPESDDGRPRSDIPIIVIAGSAEEVTLVAPIAHHIDDVVRAPIEVEDLALHLFAVVRAWREAHPDRPWADVAAAQTTDSSG